MADILANYVKFLRGTPTAYANLAEKNADTLYFVSETGATTGELYLGQVKISGSLSESDLVAYLSQLSDVDTAGATQNSLLGFDSTLQKWVPMDVNDLVHIPEFEVVPTQVFDVEVAEGETNDDAIARIVGESVLAAGDICIVKNPIVDGKFEYTAYVHDGQKWKAMDGNYNAKNVYFDDDFTFTTKIGTVQTLTNGSTKVDAAGKNLYEFFAGLFAAETEPTKTNPSVKSLTLGKAGAYEAGTVVSDITYSATFDDGSYQYGPEPTGAAVTAWSIVDNAGNSIGTAASGDIADITVQGNTNFSLKATATYSDGSWAKTNLGNASTKTRISAGTTAAKTSSAITGYWQSFYGVLAESVKGDIAGTIDSAFIREKLTHGGAYAAGDIELAAADCEGAKCLIVACPASKAGISNAIMPSALQSPIPWVSGSPFTVVVEGFTSAASTNYNVWVYEPAAMDSTETYRITLG